MKATKLLDIIRLEGDNNSSEKLQRKRKKAEVFLINDITELLNARQGKNKPRLGGDDNDDYDDSDGDSDSSKKSSHSYEHGTEIYENSTELILFYQYICTSIFF